MVLIFAHYIWGPFTISVSACVGLKKLGRYLSLVQINVVTDNILYVNMPCLIINLNMEQAFDKL